MIFTSRPTGSNRVGSISRVQRALRFAPLSVLVGASVLGLSAEASAHIDLIEPAARVPGGLSSTQKTAPCGDPMNVGRGEPHVFAPGEEITIQLDESIDHPAYYRVAFDDDGEDFPERTNIDPATTTQENDDPEAEYPVDGQTILAYFYEDPDQDSYTWTVKLPNIQCENCTLQVIQFMYNNLNAPYYHQCADIALRGDVMGQGGNGGAGGAATGGAGQMEPDAMSMGGVGGMAEQGMGGSGGMDTGAAGMTGTAMMPEMNPPSAMEPAMEPAMDPVVNAPVQMNVQPTMNAQTGQQMGAAGMAAQQTTPPTMTMTSTSATSAPAPSASAMMDSGGGSDGGGCSVVTPRGVSAHGDSRAAWGLVLIGLAGLFAGRRRRI